MEIHGKLVDIHNKVIFPATITVEKGIITKIERNSHRGKGFILPGFVDAHVHIESSLLPPSEFARLSVRHGTVATVSDSNVLIDFMRQNASKVPLKFFFDVPLNLPLCTTLSEARAKKGTKILMREGSIDKNFTTLLPLLSEAPEHCMFCTDHLFPDSLILGHINLLVKRAVQNGMDPIAAITCASKNPVEHFGLDVGLLRVGDPADFIVVDDLVSFRVHKTYIDGECIFMDAPLFPRIDVKPINKVPSIKIIENIGLKKGAIATTRLAVGASSEDIENAVGAVMEHQGGIALSHNGKTDILLLPIAGLMSTLAGEEVARRYSDLDQIGKSFGSNISPAVLLIENHV